MNECGNCKAWFPHPPDPANLTAPRIGQCRHSPPQLIAIPMGPGQVQLQVHYPPVPDTFPACLQFVAALDLSRCLTNHTG